MPSKKKEDRIRDVVINPKTGKKTVFMVKKKKKQEEPKPKKKMEKKVVVNPDTGKKKTFVIKGKKELKPKKKQEEPKVNTIAMGNPKGFAAFYGFGQAITTRDLLKNLGNVEPALVSKIMKDVPNPDVLVYDKYLPPGMWRNLGDDFGYNTDPKLKNYFEENIRGKFDHISYPWIPENTPHPFAGQPRPKDEFDEFAKERGFPDLETGDIVVTTFKSREDYIEAKKKRIRKERAPPEHNPFKRDLSHIGL